MPMVVRHEHGHCARGRIAGRIPGFDGLR